MKIAKRIIAAVSAGTLAVLSLTGSLTHIRSDVTVNAAEKINYAKALQYSIYLYDANMCGKEVEKHSAMN